MFVEILNNACFLIKSNTTTLLVDPFIRISKLRNITYDFVLISHGHIDHCYGIRYIIKPVIGNKEVARKPGDINMDGNNMIKAGDIIIIPIKNRHPRFFQNNVFYDYFYSLIGNRTLMRCGTSYGFILLSQGQTVFYSGDTIFDKDMFCKIRQTYNPHIALISFQKHDLKSLNLLVPFNKFNNVVQELNCPVFPVHMSNRWYKNHPDLFGKFTDQHIQLDYL